MTSDDDARKDAAEQIRIATGKYRRSKRRTEELQADLIDKMRRAYALDMPKSDILRAIGHLWTRQWLDQTIGVKTKKEANR